MSVGVAMDVGMGMGMFVCVLIWVSVGVYMGVHVSVCVCAWKRVSLLTICQGEEEKRRPLRQPTKSDFQFFFKINSFIFLRVLFLSLFMFRVRILQAFSFIFRRSS